MDTFIKKATAILLRGIAISRRNILFFGPARVQWEVSDSDVAHMTKVPSVAKTECRGWLGLVRQDGGG